eukprot:14992857-Ditylum_brightwellii.AAC.1
MTQLIHRWGRAAIFRYWQRRGMLDVITGCCDEVRGKHRHHSHLPPGPVDANRPATKRKTQYL